MPNSRSCCAEMLSNGCTWTSVCKVLLDYFRMYMLFNRLIFSFQWCYWTAAEPDWWWSLNFLLRSVMLSPLFTVSTCCQYKIEWLVSSKSSCQGVTLPCVVARGLGLHPTGLGWHISFRSESDAITTGPNCRTLPSCGSGCESGSPTVGGRK